MKKLIKKEETKEMILMMMNQVEYATFFEYKLSAIIKYL
jgi:hypothetical protein